LPKPPAEYRCLRDGCNRWRTTNPTNGKQRPCCSLLCEAMRLELSRIEELVREADTPEASEDWALAVEVNDALTQLQTLKRRLIHARKTGPKQ
jgi:hypothetical protein